MKELKSEKPNPDEEFLKGEFEAETKALGDWLAGDDEYSRQKQANNEPLIKASGSSNPDRR